MLLIFSLFPVYLFAVQLEGNGPHIFSREWVFLSKDKRGFILYPSERAFFPLGFNYDHDEKGRLLEDFWDEEWRKVEEDFQEMKEMGANVVRIHLQFGKFIESPWKIKKESINQLKRVVRLAEKLGIYLYITGLGCYHPQNCPDWYKRLDEEGRWQAQAYFWETISAVCSNSPAVFCYDLMNEPVVPGTRQKDWLAPPFGDKYYTQFITLDPGNRSRQRVARQWLEQLVCAIRKNDRRHLITVGLTSFSLDQPGLTSGFVPEKISDCIDFLSVHLYPESGKLDEYKGILKKFNVGKPVVVAEVFPLYCSISELESFIIDTKHLSAGWISFYWGRTTQELEKGKTISEIVLKNWLEVFQKLSKILHSN